MDAVHFSFISLFPCGRGLQFCSSYDHLLRVDDRIWKLLILLYETRLRLVAGCSDDVEIEFCCPASDVDTREHIHSLLHLPDAHILLSYGLQYYVSLLLN